MTDIPKKLMEEARRVFDDLGDGDITGVEIIARFALSRDKRAAEIAQRIQSSGATWRSISSAILTYDTPTGQEDGT